MKKRRFVSARRDQGRVLAIHPTAMRAWYTKRDPDPGCIADGVGVVCIDGPLDARNDGWFDNYECILARYRDMIESDAVNVVLLKIGSPGGDAEGLNELCDEMVKYKDRSGKRVIAYADEGAYSAAQAIACTADEIYLPRAGGLGSIGVISGIMSFAEMNKRIGLDVRLVTSGARKADGNPDVAISDEAIAHVQRRVDSLASLFFRLVAKSRGMSVKAVKALQADTFYGADAVEAGLADAVMSLDEVLTYAAASVDLMQSA